MVEVSPEEKKNGFPLAQQGLQAASSHLLSWSRCHAFYDGDFYDGTFYDVLVMMVIVEMTKVEPDLGRVSSREVRRRSAEVRRQASSLSSASLRSTLLSSSS